MGYGNSTERQLFSDIPWQNIPELLLAICNGHDTLRLATVIDTIIKEPSILDLCLNNDPGSWPESKILRQVMGNLANSGNGLSASTTQKMYLILPSST